MTYIVRLINKATGSAYSGEVDVPEGADPREVAVGTFGSDHEVGRVYPKEHPARTGFVDELIARPQIEDED